MVICELYMLRLSETLQLKLTYKSVTSSNWDNATLMILERCARAQYNDETRNGVVR